MADNQTPEEQFAEADASGVLNAVDPANVPAPGDERPALNTPDVVSGLVRQMLVDLSNVRHEARVSGVGMAAKGVAFASAEATKMAGIFLGEGQAYFATPWNARGFIDKWVGQAAGIDG